MELGAGPKIGDAASLWNFTPSPGWTKEEVFALKLALEKFGIGKWVQISDSGVLPGKLIQQLNGQTQRLLGQQSLAAFTGLHVDVDAVRRDNEAKQGPGVVRKGGLIINSGGVMDAQAKEALRKENEEKYGLSPEYIASVVLPAPVRPTHASAAVERQPQAGGHRAKGPAQQPRPADALTFSLMHGDASALSKSQLFALLRALHRKIASLRGAGPSCAPPDAAPAPADAAAEQAAKEKARGKRKAGSDEEARQRKKAAVKTLETAEGDIEKLVAFGYPRTKCQDALDECGGNLQLAVDWLLRHLS